MAVLSSQVQSLTGQVARLEESQRQAREDLAKLRGQLEPVANLRAQISQAESHLTQPPRPDVKGALEVLNE